MFKIIQLADGGKRNAAYAIAGGKTPKAAIMTMDFSDKQLKKVLPQKEYSKYLKQQQEEYFGSLPLFSSLYLFSSETKPIVLYTSEGGTCDTCLEIFLKYGEGQRPNFDELLEMRTCMDNYDNDVNKATKKVEKLMEIMFPEKLYKFEYCMGVMADVDGNFTWDRYQKHNYLPCASPCSHISFKISSPKELKQIKLEHSHTKECNKTNNVICLVASQPAKAYSAERVEYYRQKIRSGEKLGCVVYKLDYISNYAIILDGHHRVLASMLEGIFPDCLLISPAYYRIGKRNQEKVLNLDGSTNITKSNPGISDLPEEIWKILENDKGVKENVLDEYKIRCYEYYLGKSGLEKNFPKEYENAAKKIILEANS